MPRHLGQHFLKNQAAIGQIVSALDLRSGDNVVEIGPGRGALTELLIKSPVSKIIAIEKDLDLVGFLESRSKSQEVWNKLEVIHGDILRVLPSLDSYPPPPNSKLVGNIPYYITGHLLRVIGELEHKPSLVVLTIQKEVAERICAKPPRMNLLAASVQIWAEPEILAVLPPSDFDPPPEVESAIVRLKSKNQEVRIKGLENYYKLIKIAFKQPRKTILNNLAEGFSIPKARVVEKLKQFNLTGEERGQDLSIEQLRRLSTYFAA